MTSVTTRPRNLNDSGSSVSSKPNTPTLPHTAGTPNERLLFVLSSLVGKSVTVQTKDGKEYDGVLRAIQPDNMGVILAWARQKVGKDLNEKVAKPVPEMVFLAKDWLQVTAADVDLLEAEVGAARKNKGEVLADTEIEVEGRGGGQDRELQRATAWIGDGTDMSLSSGGVGNWDQFAQNQRHFGIKSTYDEEMYTTKLNRNATAEQMREAERIAREIEKSTATSSHVLEERGQLAQTEDDMDEEDKYSTVLRPGYDGAAGGGEKLPAWAQPDAKAPATPAAAAPATAADAATPSAAAPEAAGDASAPAPAPVKTTKLRAAAKEFVPGGGGGNSFVPGGSPSGPGGFGSYGSPMQGSPGGYPMMQGGYPPQMGEMTPEQQHHYQQQMIQVNMAQQAAIQQQMRQQQQMGQMPPQAMMMMNGQGGPRMVMGPNGQPMMMGPNGPQPMMMGPPQGGMQGFPNGARPMMGGPGGPPRPGGPPPQQGGYPRPPPQQMAGPPRGAPPPGYQ